MPRRLVGITEDHAQAFVPVEDNHFLVNKTKMYVDPFFFNSSLNKRLPFRTRASQEMASVWKVCEISHVHCEKKNCTVLGWEHSPVN